MAAFTASLGNFGSAVAGTAVDCSPLDGTSVFLVGGTFVGTVQVEVTPDDGTTWIPLANGAFTAPGSLPIEHALKKVRANCTAWTSGTIKTAIMGKDSSPA